MAFFYQVSRLRPISPWMLHFSSSLFHCHPSNLNFYYLLQNKYFTKYFVKCSLKYVVEYSPKYSHNYGSLKYSHTIHSGTFGPYVLPAVIHSAVRACFPSSHFVTLWSPRLTDGPGTQDLETLFSLTFNMFHDIRLSPFYLSYPSYIVNLNSCLTPVLKP